MLPSFGFRFLFGLGHRQRLRGSHPIAVGHQSDGTGDFSLRCQG